MKIEITEIDPNRWAWLHLPVGALLGILHVVWYFMQESGVDMEMFAEGVVVIVIGIPCIVLAVMAAAWVQAAFLNSIFSLMRKGPILTVRNIDEEIKMAEETVEQRTERYLSAIKAGEDLKDAL